MKKYMITALTLLSIGLALYAYADQFDGEFTPPTEREDGTALPADEILAYKVLIDGVEQAELIPGDASTFSLFTSPGNFQIQLITVDIDGRESEPSAAYSVTAKADPGAATINAIYRITVGIQRE